MQRTSKKISSTCWSGLRRKSRYKFIRGACKDVQPGVGREVDCLMRNIRTDEMNEDCEERLLEIQYIFASRDWKLNPSLS